MKNKICYIGYTICLLLVFTIFFTDFSKMVDIGIVILFSAIFSISYTQLLHSKMMKKDMDYKVNLMDERNILIKEKSGNITNMITMALLGIVTVIFISFKMMKKDMDYKVNLMDERNILIKEKSGNITNMITMALLGIVTVIFISFDYFVPAIITGIILAIQPVILIIVSSMIEKRI